MHIEEHAPLSSHTTFGLGGPARFLVRVSSVEELTEALAFAQGKHMPVLILGGGSNMLVSDDGYPGVVIAITMRGMSFEENDTKVVCVAEAGETWDTCVQEACTRELWGIENLSGIPGTVGAAPVQNIGAYGSELKDTFVWLDAFDMETGSIVRFENKECAFSYRTSFFKQHPGRYVIVRTALALTKQGMPRLAYRDLAEHFKETAPQTPMEVREAVLQIRARKFPDLSREGTAGSFFLNPIIEEEKAAALTAKFPELPTYTADGGVKISLAWILDHILNVRGLRMGAARLFEKQPIVVVADRGAHTRDVEALAAHVIERVKETVGIDIEKEVQLVR